MKNKIDYEKIPEFLPNNQEAIRNYLWQIRGTLNASPKDGNHILEKIADFQRAELETLCDKFGYNLKGFEFRFFNDLGEIEGIKQPQIDLSGEKYLQERRIERGIVKSSESQENKEKFFGNLLVLYTALKNENPDKVIGILRGGAGYASLAKLFGYDVDYIEAHDSESPRYKGDNFQKSTIKDLESKSKVLLIEDSISQEKRKRTYELVKEELIRKFNVEKDNFSLFISGMPDVSSNNLENHNQVLSAQNTYTNPFWFNQNYFSKYDEQKLELKKLMNTAEIPLPIIYNEKEVYAMRQEMIDKLKEKLK